MRSGGIALALALLTLGVFAQILEHEFLRYDDPVYVTENPILVAGPTLEAMARAFREPYEANWIPLTWISLQLDYAWHGLDPAGYHATNLALHLLAGLLLFFALRRATGDLAPSAFVAAVFAVHPLHVESVAWISERKDTLSAAFFALTLLLYVGFVERRTPARYLAVLLSAAAGLLAKPMLVTLPCVLLLLDHWPLGRLSSSREIRRALLEKLPLLALAFLASGAALYAQQRYGTMDHGDALELPLRLGNAVVSVVLYLRDSLWPTGLSIFYPHPTSDLPVGRIALAGAILLALSGLVVWQRRRAPWALVGWLWYLGMLVPVLGLVQVGMQARADRYTYLPLIGVAIALAWSVQALARTPVARRVAGVAGLASVLALAVTAHFQARHWRDTESLFRHATRVDPDNWFAHQWMGSEQLRRHAIDEAEQSFRRSASLQPEWSATHRGLADVHAERGEWAEAIRGYERALRLRPRDTKGHMRLARALAASGQTAEALGRARHAVSLAKGRERVEAMVILGFVHLERAEFARALEVCEQALQIHSDVAAVHSVRGLALMRLGRPDEATAAFGRALALAEATGDVDLAQRIRSLR